MFTKEHELESDSVLESESQSGTWSSMRDEYWDGDSYYEEIFEKMENGATNMAWNPDINRYDYI